MSGTTPARHLAYPALSRPLTVMGCERRLFLGAACAGAAAFSSFNAPVAGILLFAFGYGAGLLSTVVLRSAAYARRYDPALRSEAPRVIEIVLAEAS